jgi:hypothetical protein
MKEFKDEVVKLTREYGEAFQGIDYAIKDYKKKEEELEQAKSAFNSSPWVLYRKYFILLSIALVILAGYTSYRMSGDCSLSIKTAGFSLDVHQRRCK